MAEIIKKKTQGQRLSDIELVIGRLLSKMDRLELSELVNEKDAFGDPKRAGLSWTAKEKLSFIEAFLIFIEARASYHKRSVDAMLAYLEHNDLLRHHNLKTKKDKLDDAVSKDQNQV